MCGCKFLKIRFFFEELLSRKGINIRQHQERLRLQGLLRGLLEGGGLRRPIRREGLLSGQDETSTGVVCEV